MFKKLYSQKNYFFKAFFGFLVSPTGIGDRFWSQNGTPGGIIEGFLKQKLVFEVLSQLFDDILEKNTQIQKYRVQNAKIQIYKITKYKYKWRDKQ